MSRSLASGLAAALAADRVAPIILVKVNTTGGDVLVWSGQGSVLFAGETYIGVGNFGTISEVLEETDLGANGVTLSLSGIPSAYVAIALDQVQHNRPATIWLGAIALDTGELIADPYQLFSGFTDVPTLEDSATTSTMKITLENKMIDLLKPRTRRYTQEDQKIDHPTDLGFIFVPSIIDQSLVWGKGWGKPI